MKKLFNKKLLKNKVYALAMMLLGGLTILIDGDCTAFIFTLFLGLPLFFARKNVIN